LGFSASIVILLDTQAPQFIAKARELGASGYVNKLAAEAELARAIQTTASGEEFFS